MFDISGRKMTERKLTDGEMNFVDLPVGLRGVIVVKVTDGGNVVNRKVAISSGNRQ